MDLMVFAKAALAGVALAVVLLPTATNAEVACASSDVVVGDANAGQSMLPMPDAIGQSMLQVEVQRKAPKAPAAPQTSPQHSTQVAVSDRAKALQHDGDARARQGSLAGLDDKGYQLVVGARCQLEMELYMRRVISNLDLELCDEDGLLNMLQEASCPQYAACMSVDPKSSTCLHDSGCSFSALTTLITGPTPSTQCSFIASSGSCPGTPSPSWCRKNPNLASHRRRQCKARIERGPANPAALLSSILSPARPAPHGPNPDPGTECQLPAGAVWCEVRLTNLPAYWMAVYDWNVAEDWVSYNICQAGHWEESDMSAFGPPGHVFDIGGNIGYHTFAFAQAGWTVTSFEPMKPNLHLQQATLCRNPLLAPRVDVHWNGLGTVNQQCRMMAPKNNIGDGFTRCANLDGATPRQSDENTFIEKGAFEVFRLDEVLPNLNIAKVDVVKIDVEGYEYQVFASAPNFLKQYQPRVIKTEVWPNLVGSTSPVSASEYLAIFEREGYKTFQDVSCKVPMDRSQVISGGYVDVVMCK